MADGVVTAAGLVATLELDTGNLPAALDKVYAEILKTEERLKKLQKEIDFTGDSSGECGKKLEQLTRAHVDLNKTAADLTASLEREAKAQEKLDAAFAKTQKALEDFDRREAEISDKKSARADKTLEKLMAASEREESLRTKALNDVVNFELSILKAQETGDAREDARLAEVERKWYAHLEKKDAAAKVKSDKTYADNLDKEVAAIQKAESDKANAIQSALDKATAARISAEERDRAAREKDLAETIAVIDQKIAAENKLIAAQAAKSDKANVAGANWQLGQMTIQPGEVDAFAAAMNRATIAQAQLSHASNAAADVQSRMNVVLAEGVTMEQQATKTVANRAQKLQELAVTLQTTSRAQMGLNGPIASYTQLANQSRGASENAGYGMLHIAHAMQDAQYGFGAVLNNIPLVVQALGGGYGLAAVIMTVGVALNVARPLLGDFDVALGLTADRATKTASSIDELKEKLKALTEKGWKVQVDYDAIRDTEEKIKNREKAQESFESGVKSPEKEFVEKIAKDKAEDAGGTAVLAQMASSDAASKGRNYGSQSDINTVKDATREAEIARKESKDDFFGENSPGNLFAKQLEAKAAEAQQRIDKANKDRAVELAGKLRLGDPAAVQYFQDLAKDPNSGMTEKQKTAVRSIPNSTAQGKELYAQQTPQEKAKEAQFLEQQKKDDQYKEENRKKEQASEQNERDAHKATVELAELILPGIKDAALDIAIAIDNGADRTIAEKGLAGRLREGKGEKALNFEDAEKAASDLIRNAMKGTPEDRERKQRQDAKQKKSELSKKAEEAMPGVDSFAERAVAKAYIEGQNKPGHWIGERKKVNVFRGKGARRRKIATRMEGGAWVDGTDWAKAKKEISDQLAAGPNGLKGKELADATEVKFKEATDSVNKKVTDKANALNAHETRAANSEISSTSNLTSRIQSGVGNKADKQTTLLADLLKAVQDGNEKIIQVGVQG